jgi:hypothetical protein
LAEKLRVWSQEGVSGMSDITIGIVMEEMEDSMLPTAFEECIYLGEVNSLV